MSKKVIIKTECPDCMGEGFLNEAGCPTCDQTGVKTQILPGDLLASFKNKAVFCTDKAGGKRDLCFRIEESDTIRQDKDYRVLILGDPEPATKTADKEVKT